MKDINVKAIFPPRLLWPLAVLGGLLLFNLFFTPGFFDFEYRDGRLYGSLVDVVDRGAPLMIVSLGMTLVIATAGVDLSVGAIMAIAGAVAAGIITMTPGNQFGIPPTFTAAIVGALIAAAVAGFANGALVSALKIQPIVATLVLMVAGRGIAQLLVEGQIITFRNPEFAFLGNGAYKHLPISFTIVAAVYLVGWIFTRLTAFGLFVEAVGDNPVASRYSGLPLAQVRFIVYLVSGLCAGIAGILVTADITGADANNAGLYMELDAILAVVLGGTSLSGGRFSLLGTLIGALLIQTLTTTILTQGLPIHFTLIVKAVVIVIVCLLQAGVVGRSLAALRQRRRA